MYYLYLSNKFLVGHFIYIMKYINKNNNTEKWEILKDLIYNN